MACLAGLSVFGGLCQPQRHMDVCDTFQWVDQSLEPPQEQLLDLLSDRLIAGATE